MDIWFTKTADSPEMAAVNDLVAKAKKASFPDVRARRFDDLNAIIDRQVRGRLFVKGVISTMDRTDQTKEANCHADSARR